MGPWIRRAVTIAGLAIAVLALASCGDDETAGEEKTLSYFLTYFEGPYFDRDYARFEQLGVEPSPGRPKQPGVVAIAGTLEDRPQDQEPAGEVNGFCTVNLAGNGGDRHACIGIVDLPDGQLNISWGGVIPRGTEGVTGSITGGTGDYKGATGSYEVVFEEGPPGPPKQVFTFTLP